MPKLVHLSADDGNFVREIKEAIAEGKIPKGSVLGGMARSAQGPFPRPKNAVGTFAVRPKESRWIVA